MSRTRLQSERGSQEMGIVFVMFAFAFLIAVPSLLKYCGWNTWHDAPFWAKAIVIAVPILSLVAMIVVNNATTWKKDFGPPPPSSDEKKPPSTP